jgi:hypothetical protein
MTLPFKTVDVEPRGNRTRFLIPSAKIALVKAVSAIIIKSILIDLLFTIIFTLLAIRY